jgi:cytochrome c peroxidase
MSGHAIRQSESMKRVGRSRSRCAMRPSGTTCALLLCVAQLTLAATDKPPSAENREAGARDPGRRLSSNAPEVLLGDRLFFETRFAQYFFAHNNGDVNAPLKAGDPVVDQVLRPGRAGLEGPFRGRSMSCRHCHLGDDFIRTQSQAQRTYVDFTARSAIPLRGDGLTQTVRNSPTMVDFGLPREVPRLFHFDAEFATAEDLVIETLVGRNMGWQFDERAAAVAHIARVIREDRGTNPRHVKTLEDEGIPYRIVMAGNDPSLPEHLKIPDEFRLDVQRASETDVLQAIARLMHAYMDSIRFGVEDTHREAGSPYDLFLVKNQLPTKPNVGELSLTYATRLANLIQQRTQFKWVVPAQDGRFELHAQPFQFGESELKGLKLFLGNCIACHAPPQFTDHRLHNTGVSQADYDALFGAGAFAALKIPGLAERNRRPDAYLPASVQHPDAQSRFRSAPSRDHPGFADLGVWNVFANADFPKPQNALSQMLCDSDSSRARGCTPTALLLSAVARFKTPSIRDLGHSDPYFHSGSAATLEEVMAFYLRASDLARADRLRNSAPELRAVRLGDEDIRTLAAFLRSLNEDYH